MGFAVFSRSVAAAVLAALGACACLRTNGGEHAGAAAGGTDEATAGAPGQGQGGAVQAGGIGATGHAGASGADSGLESLVDCPGVQEVSAECGIPPATYVDVAQCDVPFPRDWEPGEPLDGCARWPRDPERMTVLVNCEVMQSGSAADYDLATDSVIFSGATCDAALSGGVRIDFVFGCGTVCR